MPVVDRDARLNCLGSGLPGRYAMVVPGLDRAALAPYELGQRIILKVSGESLGSSGIQLDPPSKAKESDP